MGRVSGWQAGAWLAVAAVLVQLAPGIALAARRDIPSAQPSPARLAPPPGEPALDAALLAQATRSRASDTEAVVRPLVTGLGLATAVLLLIAGFVLLRDRFGAALAVAESTLDRWLDPARRGEPSVFGRDDPRAGTGGMRRSEIARLARISAASNFPGLSRRLAVQRPFTLPERDEIAGALLRVAGYPSIVASDEFHGALRLAVATFARLGDWPHLVELDGSFGGVMRADAEIAAIVALAAGLSPARQAGSPAALDALRRAYPVPDAAPLGLTLTGVRVL